MVAVNCDLLIEQRRVRRRGERRRGGVLDNLREAAGAGGEFGRSAVGRLDVVAAERERRGREGR